MPFYSSGSPTDVRRGLPGFQQRFFASIDTRQGLRTGALLLVFTLALAALVCRDVSLFTHAQFYAEDGSVWYAQAYNGGWLHSLVRADGGYLNTLQRLAAGAALLVPFRWAPLVMAIAGLLIQALPVPILLSERCRNWAPLSVRIAFAAAYVAIPNAREIHVVCTNSQWHLGLALVLIALAAAPRSLIGKIFDVCVLAVSAVSGPFAILCLPLVAAFWAVRRQRWTLVVLGMLAGGSAIQIVYLLHNPHARAGCGVLGATTAGFAKLLGGNAFLGALLGSGTYGFFLPLARSVAALILGLVMCGYCARFATLEVRLFFVNCFAIFAAGLRSPLICSPGYTQWGALLTQASQRYSFFPGFALLFAMLWCARMAPSVAMRVTGLLLVIVFVCFGVRRDWRIPALPDMGFSHYAAAFEAAPAGSHIAIPLYPPPGWTMELTKKGG